MKDFTSQQREIVARKLGYDGPMQGFDEYIASSPSLGAKYAAITGKFAERMAKGGLVKMKKYLVGGELLLTRLLLIRLLRIKLMLLTLLL
jgi:hypothetical protein